MWVAYLVSSQLVPTWWTARLGGGAGAATWDDGGNSTPDNASPLWFWLGRLKGGVAGTQVLEVDGRFFKYIFLTSGSIVRGRGLKNRFPYGTRFIDGGSRHRSLVNGVTRGLRCLTSRFKVGHQDKFIGGRGLKVRHGQTGCHHPLLLTTKGTTKVVVYLVKGTSPYGRL